MIEVNNLSKKFSLHQSGKGFSGSIKGLFYREKKIVEAVNNISFAIKPGEFVGYVGENGAGKSTTIKILTGILFPSSGSCIVKGVVPYSKRRENAFNIGVVFGQRSQLWWDLPVAESYRLLKSIYKVSDSDFKSKMDELTKILNLAPLLDVPVRKLSLGQRMKCDLVASLIHNPPVLFLDEPTIGLDVIAKESIRNFLFALNKENGTTIILTTHDMNDIEHLCGRLIILDKGKIIYDGRKDALKENFIHEKLIEVEFDRLVEYRNDIPELEIVSDQGNKKSFALKRQELKIADIIGKVMSLYHIKDLSIRDPSVETIVKAIYERNNQ
jgi:ABC-2 type transport system ATP-binding protein